MCLTRGRRLRRTYAQRVSILILMLLSLTGVSPVKAQEDDISPRNGEVVTKTPTIIQLQVAGSAPVRVTLENDQGVLIPFTGEYTREDGYLAVKPPALTSGTYIVRWDSDAGERWSSFSVGEVSAVVTAGSFNVYLVLAIGAFLVLSIGLLLIGKSRGNALLITLGVICTTLGMLGEVAALKTTSDFKLKDKEIATLSASECLKSSNRLDVERCLTGLYVSIAYASTPKEASESLQQDMAKYPMLRYYCHHTSHAIGRASFDIYESIKVAFESGIEVCDFGYFHGIIEEASGFQSDSEFVTAIPSLCTELTTNSLFYMQCIHGIGHAIAQRTNNDMLRGLEICESLDEVLVEQQVAIRTACGTGVTMEWFSVATSGGLESVSPLVDSPREVCSQVASRWASACYEYIGNTVDSSRPYESLLEIGSWCSISEYAESCYIGLARAGVGLSVPAKEILDICQNSNNTLITDTCLEFYIVSKATTIDFTIDSVTTTCDSLNALVDARALCTSAYEKVQGILASVELTGASTTTG